MKNQEAVHFFESEEIFEKAKNIFNRKKEEIEKMIEDADVQHVGSCAIPGAVGKFDVDVQVRISKDSFDKSVEVLYKQYNRKHPELWNGEMAIFEQEDEVQIDIVLTVIDSKYDDYYKVRDYLINNPEKLEEYNELKRSFEGELYSEYRKAKAEFLGSNGDVKFL